MSSLVAWLRGPASPKTRQERRDFLAFLLGVGFLVACLDVLVAGWTVLTSAVASPWPGWRPQAVHLFAGAAAAGLLLAALAVLSPVASPRLLGPVLFYDLVRIARRARYYLIRVLYLTALLGLLCWVYLVWTTDHPSGYAVSASEAASFAATFFSTFMVVQYLVITVVTPAYVAGCLAEEKERKTLEFLLATDLRDREIVLGKLLSRGLNLLMLLLTGLPVLGALQFLGGVDPMLVIAGFAVTALTAASLAGLSIYNSATARRARDAIALTYLMAAAYLVVSGLSWLLLIPTGWADFPADFWPETPIKLHDLVEWFNAGNVVAAVSLLQYKVSANVPLADVLVTTLRNYALFHGILALGGPLWVALRLRAIALTEASRTPGRAAAVDKHGGDGRPARHVGRLPMVWKEVVAEGGLRLNRAGRVIIVLLVPISFLPAVITTVWRLDAELISLVTLLFVLASVPLMLVVAGTRRGRVFLPVLLIGLLLACGLMLRVLDDGHGSTWDRMSSVINIVHVRVVGTVVALLLLMAVAVRASGSVSGERDRQTLDELLTTPLDSDTILVGKWLGAVLSVRRGWLWLGAIWGLGVATGGLHPFLLPLLVVTWFVYAAFLATLGLWFSVVSRTTMRATLWTLICAVGAGVGHWLVTMCCGSLLTAGIVADVPDVVQWLVSFQGGLTPPAVFGYYLTFPMEEISGNPDAPEHIWRFVGFAVLGTTCWAGLAALLWVGTSARFRELTRRLPRYRPAQRPAARKVVAAAPRDEAR